MRAIAVFEKSERVRHIGHLDLMRAMQRALRRSGVPVDYSKGFSPHVLVTFASALPVGAVGLREVMDASMADEIDPEAFVRMMNKALPPELPVLSCRMVDQRHPAMMALLEAGAWRIRFDEADRAERIREALPRVMAETSIITPRKTKSGIKDAEIRPLILSAEMEGDTLRTVLIQTEQQSCKPDMLLAVLAKYAGMEEKPHAFLTREALFGRAPDGSLAPLEAL